VILVCSNISIPSSRIDKAPAERSRLYGLLAWLNAIIQERLRYAPLGWTKRYVDYLVMVVLVCVIV
jgi:hypothetical protein